jgi:hypothetical protein
MMLAPALAKSGLAYQRAYRQIGHVVIVHHVEMDNVCAGGDHVFNLFAQAGKVGGQDTGGDAIGTHGGASFEVAHPF